jgi:hypothetical protein
MSNNEHLKQYANEMLRQLGGKDFLKMTGAKRLTYASGEQLGNECCIVALIMFLPNNAFNKHKIKRIEMCLMGNDTYTFKFYKGISKTPFKEISDVYCDEVQDIFELNTGLLVTLYNRKYSQVVVGVNI